MSYLYLLITNNITYLFLFIYFFFFNDTATTEFYTLSLHDALPISEFVAQPRLDLCGVRAGAPIRRDEFRDRKSTRLNSSHVEISYAVVCLNKKKHARARSGPPGRKAGQRPGHHARVRERARLPRRLRPDAPRCHLFPFLLRIRPPPASTLFPYTTLFR